MEHFTLARIIHIVAVVLWIGGVGMVTTVIIKRIFLGREILEIMMPL